MYADLAAGASFWTKLVEIDLELAKRAVDEGCPLCGGPLHVANYPRKPRGIVDAVAEAFALRYSTCCGHCRRRCTPLSVRFLGRRVYVGAIVLLATMHALVCGAARRTLDRWSAWWTQQLPATTFWLGVRARFVPAIPVSTLPAGLLERFESVAGGHSGPALIATLKFLSPLTSQTAVRTVDEGSRRFGEGTHKMRIDSPRRGLLPSSQAPPPKR